MKRKRERERIKNINFVTVNFNLVYIVYFCVHTHKSFVLDFVDLCLEGVVPGQMESLGQTLLLEDGWW